jgi:hypothetical protein
VLGLGWEEDEALLTLVGIYRSVIWWRRTSSVPTGILPLVIGSTMR